jgi:hypothetical protein
LLSTARERCCPDLLGAWALGCGWCERRGDTERLLVDCERRGVTLCWLRPLDEPRGAVAL